ncbi:MAG: hypothetical protein GY857_06180 [Desulfobacula sp.]|nr:hypothetical protein [Desulfobacula sp.]
MSFFRIKRLLAGIELGPDNIKSALIFKKGNNFSITQLSDVKMPMQTLKPSFKKENILNLESFQDSLKKICREIKVQKIGVALPDSCVKVLVKTYKALPKEITKIDEMVSWDIASSLNLSANELRIDWQKMGKNSDNAHVLLIVLGMENIIVQYEQAFKKYGVSPLMLTPAGLNQFNFYSTVLPSKGIIAYLGLFDDFLNLFVFSDDVPIFYKMIKKGVLSDDETSAVNDVDLLIQYYNSENPDLEIGKFFIASNTKSQIQIEYILQDIHSAEFTIIDEKQLISFDKSFKLDHNYNPLPFYTSVIGAAQSL